MYPERNYLRWFFASVAVLLAAVATTNLVVDPYGVFDSPRLKGFNAEKPAFLEQLRLTHAYAVAWRKPRCILLGTSRTGRGLDPSHGTLSGVDCYNMALPSMSLYEMRRYFQHAQAIRPLERVILGLDFRVFGTPVDISGAFTEARLGVDSDGHPQFNLFSATLPDLASVLISLPASQASAKTVRQQGWGKETLGPNGFWLQISERHDTRAAFVAFTRDTLGRYADMRETDAVFADSFQELRKLLRAAYGSNVEVFLLFSPSHAWHWQSLELSGLWPRFETIKRNVVAINAEESTRAGRPEYPVWDFSGAYGPSLEPPPRSDDASMRWYWEPVHYKPELGDLMLNRMLRNSVSPQWPDFGMMLERDNLELHLTRLRDLQQEYATENPDVIAAIRTLMKEGN
jgi:hypothetical protein